MNEALATYCANHPDRETGLRCNRCGKYICSLCAVQTPTGYRCRECVRGQQKVFETAKSRDYIIAFVVAAVLSAIGGWLSSFIGFFTIFLAPLAGNLIASAIRATTGRRRSPLLFRAGATGVVLGAAPFILLPLVLLVTNGSGLAIFGVIWPLVYSAIAAPTTYYRLSGIQINR